LEEEMQKRLIISLPLAAVLAVPALAQTNQPQSQSTQPNQIQSTQSATVKSDSDRAPLTLEQHEGFWGRINPFARKKYVRKQLTPVVGRVNELDELTASNSRMIKDVDSRATEGIRLATAKATEADTHALDATNRANQAHETATQATARLGNVEKAVTNIDQYQKVQDTEIRFRTGQSVLSAKAKEALDQIAEPLKSQRGYVVEIQGFAPGRGQASIASSQKMADAVVRYLVVQHDVPVYRIYTLGMGNAALKSADGTSAKVRTGKVEVTLMKNDLSGLESASNAPVNSSTMPAVQAPAASATQNAAPASNVPSNVPSQALPQSDQPVNQAPKAQPTTVVPPKN
jgi:outer membrane protein OmpA-like peptidoglycan-associated protein